MSDDPRTCPHCGGPLDKWAVPDGASWDDEFFLVCFNNECPYYTRGWEWMKEQYNQEASYRYAFIPSSGSSSMIPVWSDEATRNMIVDDKGGGCG
ncbi:ogr/Delta-like zinc finger family protein [Gemmatimonadota bacterium]